MQDHLLPYETETQAKQALQIGEISTYYVIPADYVARGEVEYVYPDDKSYLSDGQSWVIKWTLNLNLLDGDLELADQIWNPIWHFEARSIAPEFQGVALRHRLFCHANGGGHVPRPEFALQAALFGQALFPGAGRTRIRKYYGGDSCKLV